MFRSLIRKVNDIIMIRIIIIIIIIIIIVIITEYYSKHWCASFVKVWVASLAVCV